MAVDKFGMIEHCSKKICSLAWLLLFGGFPFEWQQIEPQRLTQFYNEPTRQQKGGGAALLLCLAVAGPARAKKKPICVMPHSAYRPGRDRRERKRTGPVGLEPDELNA